MYQNFTGDDPPYDHVAIQANGDVNHLSKNNLAGPVSALANSDISKIVNGMYCM